MFTVNPEEAKIVAWIFQTYSESGTVLSITKELNRQGLKTHYGAWNTNSVWTILTNPFYYGAMRYNYRNESKGLSSWSFRPPEDVIIVPGHHEAIITKGGIKIKEVDPGTMESRLVKGLHFAGEVLDLDAVTGGFNLQIAWSTAYAAGTGIESADE